MSERKIDKATGIVSDVSVATSTKTHCKCGFGVRVDGYVDDGSDFSDPVVVKYARVPTYKKTGDKDTDFVVGFKIIETERYNVTERANSYRDDSDVYGVLDKVLKTGDISNAIRDSLDKPYVDVSNMPKDLIDAGQVVGDAKRAYLNIPDALAHGASFDTIATQFGQKEIDAYISSIKSKTPVENGGDNNE